MVINSTNINKANLSSLLNPFNTKETKHMTLEIQILAWDNTNM